MAYVFGSKGRANGRRAYLSGQSITDNPYDSAAYAYTDEGLARDGWHKGFEDAWFDAGCPAERWPDMANTIAAVERREAFKLEHQKDSI